MVLCNNSFPNIFPPLARPSIGSFSSEAPGNIVLVNVSKILKGFDSSDACS